MQGFKADRKHIDTSHHDKPPKAMLYVMAWLASVVFFSVLAFLAGVGVFS